jgi:GTPase
LHIEGVRQTVQAVKVEEKGSMRTGDSGVIRFKFKYGVEYIEKNAKIMVREGSTKCFGYVTKVYPMLQPP